MNQSFCCFMGVVNEGCSYDIDAASKPGPRVLREATVILRCRCTCVGTRSHYILFRGLRPEAGNAGSRGDLSHIILEVVETLLQFRSAHMRPPKPSPKA